MLDKNYDTSEKVMSRTIYQYYNKIKIMKKIWAIIPLILIGFVGVQEADATAPNMCRDTPAGDLCIQHTRLNYIDLFFLITIVGVPFGVFYLVLGKIIKTSKIENSKND
jgi:hypothetical protein